MNIHQFCGGSIFLFKVSIATSPTEPPPWFLLRTSTNSTHFSWLKFFTLTILLIMNNHTVCLGKSFFCTWDIRLDFVGITMIPNGKTIRNNNLINVVNKHLIGEPKQRKEDLMDEFIDPPGTMSSYLMIQMVLPWPFQSLWGGELSTLV